MLQTLPMLLMNYHICITIIKVILAHEGGGSYAQSNGMFFMTFEINNIVIICMVIFLYCDNEWNAFFYNFC